MHLVEGKGKESRGRREGICDSTSCAYRFRLYVCEGDLRLCLKVERVCWKLSEMK